MKSQAEVNNSRLNIDMILRSKAASVFKLSFEKAQELFPIELNMTNEDEYMVAKDSFFNAYPHLKEFANLK